MNSIHFFYNNPWTQYCLFSGSVFSKLKSIFGQDFVRSPNHWHHCYSSINLLLLEIRGINVCLCKCFWFCFHNHYQQRNTFVSFIVSCRHFRVRNANKSNLNRFISIYPVYLYRFNAGDRTRDHRNLFVFLSGSFSSIRSFNSEMVRIVIV